MKKIPTFNKMVKGADVIVLDIDGTLVDITNIHVDAFEDAFLKGAGLRIDGRIAHYQYSGNPEDTLNRLVLEHYKQKGDYKGEITPEIIGRIGKLHAEAIAKSQDISPKNVIKGVIPFLEKNLEKGKLVVVISGGPKKQSMALLEKTGLAKYASATAFSDELFNGKPIKKRSEILQLGLQRVEKRTGRHFIKGKILVIGDSPSDIEAARDLGLRVTSVATGQRNKRTLRRFEPDKAIRRLRIPLKDRAFDVFRMSARSISKMRHRR